MPEQARDPYCKTLPLQLRYWDATSLRTAQECPRKFEYVQNMGYGRRGRIDLDFGSRYHEAAEMFDKLLLAGWSREAATEEVFYVFLMQTATDDPLESSYHPVWRCTASGTKECSRGPRKGEQIPDPKQCRRAKEPQFLLPGNDAPETCCDCGLPVVQDWQLVAANRNKNRDTLLTTILFYCDTADDRVRPYKFPDGTVAVELSFHLPLPLESPDARAHYLCNACGKRWYGAFKAVDEVGKCDCGGKWKWVAEYQEPYMLCGNMDGMVEFAGEVVPRERKTTKNDISKPYFWYKYEPDVQIDTYDLAAWLLYSDNLETKPSGVMVEVTRVTPDEISIDRQIIAVPEERRAEHLQDIMCTIKEMEGYARTGYYPKRTAHCEMHGGCPFRKVCSKSPVVRKRYLESGEDFIKRAERWNPAQTR